MPKHQAFVDYFTHEFMEELWYLQKVARGDIPARKESDPWEKFFNVTSALLSITPIPGLPLGFLLSKELVQQCVKYGGQALKAARSVQGAAQSGYQQAKALLDKVDEAQGVYDSVMDKDAKGFLQQSKDGPMDLEAIRVLVEWVGHGLAERYEHLLTDYIVSDPPDKGIVPLARVAARRLFAYLQSQPLLADALPGGLLAQRERLLNGVVLGNLDKSWREQLTAHAGALLPRLVKDMGKATLPLQDAPKKQLGRLENYPVKDALKCSAWYDEKQGYQRAKTKWWEPKNQPKQPKYGYAVLAVLVAQLPDLKPLPPAGYVAPPRQNRYYQPVTALDIQAYLDCPEVKTARAQKKTAALSFHDFLIRSGRP